MTANTPSVGKLLLRTVLWLVPCFAAWHLAAQHHAAVAGRLSLLLVNWITPGIVSAQEASGTDLVFVTGIKVHVAGKVGALLVEVNPQIYTYGLAFFLALMLATRARWWKVLAGAGVLLAFQGWGIAFDFLVQVGIKLGPEIASQAGLFGWRREAIALGYQVGSLILPTLAPIVLWAAFNRPFIESALSPGSTPRAMSMDT